MRKRKIAYVCRMVIKTILCLLPLLVILFVSFGSNVITESIYDNYLLTSLSYFLEELSYSPLNAWYFTLLDIFGLSNIFGGGQISNILIILPLYYLWVEIFDLLLHFLLFIPNIIHSFMRED